MNYSIRPYKFRISTYAQKVLQKVINKVPNMTIENKKTLQTIKWIGDHISSPQNRLILGVSALLSQPFIDLHNKRVDEDTRKTSAARTVAKIIAGTATGFLVRYGAIKAVDMMAKVPAKNLKWWETLLSPDRTKVAYKDLNQYKKAFGTILALVVMLATNFIIDAPLTKVLTNKFISKIKKNENENTPPPINPFNQQDKLMAENGTTNLIKIKIDKLNSKGKEVNNG